jgi:hypothetical protein
MIQEMMTQFLYQMLTQQYLKKVIQWCTHHRGAPPPEDDENKEKRTDVCV